MQENRVDDHVLKRIRAAISKYAPFAVDAPTIQPLADLLNVCGEAMRERLFIVQGDDGTEACLRPDFTFAIAREWASSEWAEGRFRYEGYAFRVPPEAGATHHPSEFLQIGFEAFGAPKDAVETDALLAKVAWRAAKIGGRDDLSVRIGDVRFFSAFLDDIGVPDIAAERLRRSFTRPSRLKAELRRSTGSRSTQTTVLSTTDVVRFWKKNDLSEVGGRTAEEISQRLAARAIENSLPRLTDWQVNLIEQYLAIRGPALQVRAQIRQLLESSLLEEGRVWKASRGWTRFVESLAQEGIDQDRVLFDASFGGPFSYYDGFVFEIVSDALGPDAAVAAGGRYDALIASLTGRSGLAAAGCMVRPYRAWNGERR